MASSLPILCLSAEYFTLRRSSYFLYTCTLALSLTGCYSRVVNPEDFTIQKRCLNCDSIRNDGIWIAEPDKYGLGPGPMVLESDGTFLSVESRRECNRDPDPVSCHTAYMTDIDSIRTLTGHPWGRYEIRDDSIFINFVGPHYGGSIPPNYRFNARRGAIINDSTIIMGRYVKFYPQEHKRGILINDSTLFLGYYYHFYQEDLDILEESWIDTDPRFN